MKKIYLDNNIVSKLIKDEEFKVKFKEKYPENRNKFYISLGTLVEQYKGSKYDRIDLINLNLNLLLNHSDVMKYELQEKDNFWGNKMIRVKELAIFYNELDSHNLFTEEKYFGGINMDSLDLLEQWKIEINEWRGKSEEVYNKTKNSSNSKNKDKFTKEGKVRPKEIVKTQALEFSKKNYINCKGLFCQEILKKHRVLTMTRELGINDFYDIIQAIWYPYMDEIIIENKQSLYLKEMAEQEPLKNYLKNTKINSLKTI